MGAKEKSILKKCGEILIDIKTKNKKTKLYTFNCAFCNANCDQLKKFSVHLEEKHIEQFLEESLDKAVIYVPEIKAIEIKEIEMKDDLQKNLCLPLYEDPLETNKTVITDIESAVILMDFDIKDESKEQNLEMECDFNKDESDYKDCSESNEYKYSNDESSESEYNEKNNIPLSRLRQRCEKLSHQADEKAIKSKRKVEQTEKCFKTSEPEIDEKELCTTLLKAFEKQTILWKVKERTTHNKISQKYFEFIANEVNEKLKSNITWEDAKVHIRKMRNHYSAQMQKKNMGEEYELPWYAEHMKFLHENIEVLLKGRQGIRYKPLKTVDESELSIIIDIYKKYESLWQVNNIAFGAKRKRDEVFDKIIEELKLNYNINITVDNLHRRVNHLLRLYSENKKLYLKCDLEKRKFTPLSPLYEKMTFLSDCQGPFKCSQCNEILERYDIYQMHLAKHNDTIPFRCPICKKAFHKHGAYLSHARRHMDLNNEFCKFCGRGFPSKPALAIHERSHTGEYPYLCQICGATFKAPHGYDNHIRRHENRFRYNCHICNHGFNHSHELKDHVKAHLNIRDIVCNICGKSFTAIKRLKYHQLIHTEEKRYKCKVCGKAFAQTAGLRQHSKQHQPFSAQYKKDSSLNIGNV